ncbi:diaminopimelate epimerase [Candidatus Pseudothioglobus singularis]|jgi:diaminopimelate epimerase|nr:diaminopimelate epimerase [Candidatus Pseudothioglobus singularis]
MINFTKMHGLGNDFVVMNNLDGDICLSVEEIRQLSDRRFGIGFDQLLMIESATSKNADFRYVIFNADGTEVNQCGNGARCFALYIHKKNLSYKNPLTVETNAGLLVLNINSDDSVKVDMGVPNFEPSKIPLNLNQVSTNYQVEGHMIGSLSIGNPHAILIQDKFDNINDIASKIQSSELFPEGVNVGFMQVLNKNEILLRVVERGVGETYACGSGACAAVIHGVRQGLLDSTVKVHLNGGDATVEFDGEKVYLTGPGKFVYEGTVNLRSGSS